MLAFIFSELLLFDDFYNNLVIEIVYFFSNMEWVFIIALYVLLENNAEFCIWNAD